MKKAGCKSVIVLLNWMMILSYSAIAQSPIDAYILQKMKDNHFPGVGISYIKDGKIVIAKGYGHANIKQDIPFTQHTIMEIASISKTITATAAMQLWEQGLFGLKDPVNDFLPFSVVNPFFPDDTITMRMLLNHTSSMGFGLSIVNGEVEQISVLPGQALSLFVSRV